MTKRMKKIERLVLLAGQDGIKLTHVSNAELEKVYQVMLPMIREKQAEIAAVMSRESRLCQRKLQEVSGVAHNRELEKSWNRRWQHPSAIPICSIDADYREVSRLVGQYEGERKRCAKMYRQTGEKQWAERANIARKSRTVFEESLAEMVGGVK